MRKLIIHEEFYIGNESLGNFVISIPQLIQKDPSSFVQINLKSLQLIKKGEKLNQLAKE